MSGMYKDYYKLIKKQLAIDLNCNENDFDREENIVTASALNPNRRAYSKEKEFFNMATFGRNAVISADEALHPFLKEFIKDKLGFWLFEHHNLTVLEKEVNKYGCSIYHSHHMFIPCKDVKPLRDYPVKWFYEYEEIKDFYGDERFPNALCSEYKPETPDRIAVCAYDNNGEIMGMAGCSEDALHLQQIGIDVIPKYRSKGVGTYLVTLLKNKIIENGDFPFYGTGLANINSKNIAINCGFKPAWVEINSKKIAE